MREEDEIREAVIALAAAAERGENVEAELPSGDIIAEALANTKAMRAAAEAAEAGSGETSEPASPEEVRERAIAVAFDAVRRASRKSQLSQPTDWEALGIVPDSMTAEDLEMAVYDRLMEAGEAMPTGTSENAESADGSSHSVRPSNPHVNSKFSSSNGRAVGALGFKAHKAAKQSEDCLSESGYPPAPPSTSSEQNAAEEALQYPECKGIRLLMGTTSYYLYDSEVMTDAFARWAFLAAEDDPVTTFVECVREESSVYPRPMPVSTLENKPFCMTAEAVEEAFAAAREQGRADDIERICASNGEVYFYSTRYLTPRQAESLAEWAAVERFRNV